MKKTFAEREELILKLFSDVHYVPMKEKELAILLRVEPEDREELSNVLKSLLEKRKIQINKRGKYSTKAECLAVYGIFKRKKCTDDIW